MSKSVLRAVVSWTNVRTSSSWGKAEAVSNASSSTRNTETFFRCLPTMSKNMNMAASWEIFWGSGLSVQIGSYSLLPSRRQVPITSHASRHWKSHNPIKDTPTKVYAIGAKLILSKVPLEVLQNWVLIQLIVIPHIHSAPITRVISYKGQGLSKPK